MPLFSKKNVLQQANDIARILKAKSTRSPHLAYFKNPNHLKFSRLGLAIPKKNAKRAIDRNRIKRLIRENFRLSDVEIPVDMVVKLHLSIGKNTKRKLREAERVKIRHELQEHFLIKND